MRILFIHQNLPGQFVHLARHFAGRADTETLFITANRRRTLDGVKKITYQIRNLGRFGGHRYLTNFQSGTLRGEAVGHELVKLKQSGAVPDLIYAHPGWGEALYVKDLFPDVPLLNYCEFYYHAHGSDTHYDPNEPDSLDFQCRTRIKNCVNLLSLDSCDRGVSPTQWQWRQHPRQYLSKIAVIHDGIDTERVAPAADAVFDLPDGTRLDKAAEVVTYVARNLEPYRGFPSFLRAVALLCRRRPACHFLVIGGDGVSYGRRHPSGKSFRQIMLEEVEIDHHRVHFLGQIPYQQYLQALQISTAHVYLTVPFVLSWSMLEAMAAGCVVVAANTPPVAEVIEDGSNGFLVDFFSPDEIADVVEEALVNRDRLRSIREKARADVVQRYDLRQCLPAQLRLMTELSGLKGLA